MYRGAMPFAQRKKLLERSRSKKKKSKTASQSDVTTGSLVCLQTTICREHGAVVVEHQTLN